MADNEDDSSSTRTITAAEPLGAAGQTPGVETSSESVSNAETSFESVPNAETSTESVLNAETSTESVLNAETSTESVSNAETSTESVSNAETSTESVPGAETSSTVEPGAQLADLLQSYPEEQSFLVGTDFSSLGPDLVNTTTIIYVQPDGSLVEGSGLSPEEQQALLDQLTKQQIVQVSDTEAAQLLQQSQLVKTIPVHNTALDPSQLQQVINQVTKSHQQVHVQVPLQTVKQKVQVPQLTMKQKVQVAPHGLKQQVQVPQQNLKSTTQNNASQQLKSVAQQVAMQTGSSVQMVQKKSEAVRIQIQVPPKKEGKSFAVNNPHVKLSANGSMSSAQIIHIQPVVGQPGQQFFLQQNPGEPPIQLLLQSPDPVVGSLLPLVHKLTGQTTSACTASIPSQKPTRSPIRVQNPSIVQTPPSPIPQIKPPANGTTTVASKSPGKPPAVIVVVPVETATPAARSATLAPPPAVKDRDREKEKKAKKREKRAVKVQTRSGRVSRPPKYKAKDYKFIKTEDLADSHQSDSDDYSDMSVEEEDGGRKDGPAPGVSLTYSHKSRSHRCQTCEKAYIGLGGLNRHYKLNPTHGEPDLPDNTTHPLGDDGQSQETKTGGVREEEKEMKETKETKETTTKETTTTNEDKPVETASNRVEGGPASAVGLRGLHPRGPGRPRGRGRGRGRGRSLGPPPKVMVGVVGRRGRRGRPPKLAVNLVTAEQQVERRRDRLQELVEQCEDEELMDIVLPRLTKVLSLWEVLLAKVEGSGPVRTRFPDIYREFESLQAQVRQAAQDYIISPQGGALPLEVRNIEVARSLGILDEVNRMKVVPGASPSSSLTNKNVRYMENSKMLPPSKRFKMENSIPIHQNGIDTHKRDGTTVTSVTSSLKPCSVPVSPLVIPAGSKPLTPSADHSSSSSGSISALGPSSQTTPPATPMEVTPGGDQPSLQTNVKVKSLQTNQVLSTSDITAQMKELKKALGSSPETNTDSKKPDYSSVQTVASSEVQQGDSTLSESSSADPCESKELQEGQEIYIQTEGLTVQLAEPGVDRIVIVNSPDGTTMHIQTPEGVPLEAVQALLGIEASDGAKVSQ